MTSSSTGAPSGRLATPYTKRQGSWLCQRRLAAVPTQPRAFPSTCSGNRGGVQNLVCLVHRSSFLTIKPDVLQRDNWTKVLANTLVSAGLSRGVRRSASTFSRFARRAAAAIVTDSRATGSAASKAAVLRASTSPAACWRRSAFRPVRITLAPSARARRAVSNPMPALPPITTTVCPRSSSSRCIGEGIATVLIVPPIRLLYFSLCCQQPESYARLKDDVQYSL